MTPENRYERLARAGQRDHRVPALTVAVHRVDRPTWTFQVGSSGTDRPLDERTQFRMGSVTKTFTAVLVMQCRDDGLLDLDDRLDAHLAVPAHGDLTIRHMLSHTSGLQRELFGDVWETMATPGVTQMIADMERVERVLPNARRWHYSNLAYSLLGQVVAKRRGGTWEELLVERILRPLGLDSISVAPTERAAVGYLVDQYSDHAWVEPVTHERAGAPAGQLWGTPTDLAKWVGFLVDPSEVDPSAAVLTPETVAEMRHPRTPTGEEAWPLGWGLGLMLRPQGETKAFDVGHTGAMPGFLTGAFGRRGGTGRPKALGAVAMGSSSTASEVVMLPHALMDAVLAYDPADIEPWTIGEPVPDALAGVLGLWWTEGRPIIFGWRDGKLSARYEAAPSAPQMTFEPIAGETDEFRCTAGPETGERLRINRDRATGTVTSMNLATYRVSRRQEPFGSPRS